MAFSAGAESRYPPGPAQPDAGRDASTAGDGGIQVSTPSEPPSLTPGAARVLLRVLLEAARRQGVTVSDAHDCSDE
jgi:hypothetical protein